MDQMTELKGLVIEHLVHQIREKKKLADEFGIQEDRIDDLIRKLADRWITTADQVIMLATLFDIAAPRNKKERPARYIG